MKIKHTPGPWEILEGGNFVRVGASGYKRFVASGNYLGGPLSVAEVEHDATEDHSPNHGLALANAYLIAAAPDLLAACKEAYRLYCTKGLERSVRNKMQKHAEALLCEAIAKAEGKQ